MTFIALKLQISFCQDSWQNIGERPTCSQSYSSSNAWSMDDGWNNSCHRVWILLRLYNNSRLTTDKKKQTATKCKVKKQKRLLCHSTQNLHEKCCAGYPSSVISYVTFTRHRPFWIVQATTCNKDRDTCLCKKHENIQLCADKLHQLHVLKVKHCERYLIMRAAVWTDVSVCSETVIVAMGKLSSIIKVAWQMMKLKWYGASGQQ